MELKPLVSVVIPAFNAELYIREAVESITRQTYSNLEIIIINDGSTDTTLNIIKSFSDRRIKIIENAKNSGLIYSLNKGFQAASGEFIARMDSDDLARPDRIEKQVNYMLANTFVGVLGGQFKCFGLHTRVSDHPPEHDEIFKQFFYRGCVIGHPTVFIRAATIKPFLSDLYSVNFKHCEDFELWVRLAKSGVIFANLDDIILDYRTHESQVSMAHSQHQENLAKNIKYDLLFSALLVPKILRTFFVKTFDYQSSELALLLCLLYLNMINMVLNRFGRFGFLKYSLSHLLIRVSPRLKLLKLKNAYANFKHRVVYNTKRITNKIFRFPAAIYLRLMNKYAYIKHIVVYNTKRIVNRVFRVPMAIYLRLKNKFAYAEHLVVYNTKRIVNRVFRVPIAIYLRLKNKFAYVEHLVVYNTKRIVNRVFRVPIAIYLRIKNRYGELKHIAVYNTKLIMNKILVIPIVNATLKFKNKFGHFKHIALYNAKRVIHKLFHLLRYRIFHIPAVVYLKLMTKYAHLKHIIIYKAKSSFLNKFRSYLNARVFHKFKMVSDLIFLWWHRPIILRLFGSVVEQQAALKQVRAELKDKNRKIFIDDSLLKYFNHYKVLAPLGRSSKFSLQNLEGSRFLGNGHKNKSKTLTNWITSVLSVKIIRNINQNLPRGPICIEGYLSTKNVCKIDLAKYENGRAIPVIINCFNRLSDLEKLVSWLESQGMKKIIFLDNNSTYPPLLEYYQKTSHEVVYLKKNFGYLALWESNFYKQLDGHPFFYTDPDVVPDKMCPNDWLVEFVNLLNRYDFIDKVGFSLRIDDLPANDLSKKIKCHEGNFWQEKIDEHIFRAPIDTTFALYRPGVIGGYWVSAGRTNLPYVARHLPWYPELANSEENAFYRKAAAASTHWTIQMQN